MAFVLLLDSSHLDCTDCNISGQFNMNRHFYFWVKNSQFCLGKTDNTYNFQPKLALKVIIFGGRLDILICHPIADIF